MKPVPTSSSEPDAASQRRSLGRFGNTRQNLQQRALARAVATNEPYDLGSAIENRRL